MNKNEIKTALLELPNDIVQYEHLLTEATDTVNSLEVVNKNIQLYEQNKVYEELDENGKKKYSNELKRSLEVQRRVAGNEQWIKNDSEIGQLKKSIAQNMITLSHKKRLFRAYESISRLGGE